jgi:hypothetical protein
METLFSSIFEFILGQNGIFVRFLSLVNGFLTNLLSASSDNSDSSSPSNEAIPNFLMTTRNKMGKVVDSVTESVSRMAEHTGVQVHRNGEWIHSQWDKFGNLFTNPGNVRATKTEQHQESGFRKPDTPEEGFKIMADVLHHYQTGSRHLQTIRQIVETYAPPSDHNPTNAYIEHVAQWTGFKADQRLDLNDPDVLARLMKAMTRQEKGAAVASHYSDDSIRWAAEAAIDPRSAGTEPDHSGIMVAAVQSNGTPLLTPLNPIIMAALSSRRSA